MLEKFKYKFKHFDSLDDLLSGGISEVAIGNNGNGRPYAFWLILADRRVLKVTSIVSTIGNSWDELGSLVFELTSESHNPRNTIALNRSWLEIRSIRKMAFKDSSVHAESGLLIENTKGEEILVVSSSFPFSIEFFPDIFSVGFEPECDIEKYKKEAII